MMAFFTESEWRIFFRNFMNGITVGASKTRRFRRAFRTYLLNEASKLGHIGPLIPPPLVLTLSV